jgi:hypothetical protein
MDTLYNSLVGAVVEYNDMKKAENREQFEKVLNQSKRKITVELDKIYATNNKALITAALAEMVNFYELQTYALSIRSHIELRRNRENVEKYLEQSVDERQTRLLNFLETYKKQDYLREVIVIAIGYFVGVYKNRLLEFKPYLTKEEFIYVA